MAKFPPVFDENERAVLVKIYEQQNGYFNTYSMMSALNPEVETGTEDALKAFNTTRTAIEKLISRGLVSGTRRSGANGTYFDKLKLSKKGETSAIEQKDKPTGLSNADIEDARKVVAEMKAQDEKK